MQESPIRTQIVRAALARVRACGVDPRTLIERFELPADAETEPDVTLPLRQLYAFLDAAERATSDPFLGLRMAVNFPRGIYGLVEFIARNCANLGEGLRKIVEYQSLVTNRVSVTFDERDGKGVIRHELPGEPLATGRHSNEFWVCGIVLQAREILETAFVPDRVWFAHPAPPDTGELLATLGTKNVTFDAGFNQIELASSVLALPIRSADPALLSVLAREAKHDLELSPPPKTFLDQVHAAIEQRLGQGAPSLNDIARALGTSDRTLQRRLTEEGGSFRDVVEGVRERLARRYLGDHALGLGEIAYRLGYTDVSAFLRAFKRWTGMTPSQLRSK